MFNILVVTLFFSRMRDRFKSLLAETGYVTPGKRLDEVRVLFMGRESFDSLSEHDRQYIYEHHQKDITEKARQNFHVSYEIVCVIFLFFFSCGWIFSILVDFWWILSIV